MAALVVDTGALLTCIVGGEPVTIAGCITLTAATLAIAEASFRVTVAATKGVFGARGVRGKAVVAIIEGAIFAIVGDVFRRRNLDPDSLGALSYLAVTAQLFSCCQHEAVEWFNLA